MLILVLRGDEAVIEKLSLSLKKSFRMNKLKKIAHNILNDKSCDTIEMKDYSRAIQRLAEALDYNLRLERYARLSNQQKVNTLLREGFLASGLILRQTYGHQYLDGDSCYNEYSSSIFGKNATILHFPYAKMQHNLAVDAIRRILIKTLEQHYPSLLDNKTAITLLCIKKFRPQSFFAQMPKDLIKVILKHTRNMEDIQPKIKLKPER
jgi:soluble cytochrome b562